MSHLLPPLLAYALCLCAAARCAVLQDVEYANPGTPLLLDLYLPDTPGAHPLLVWIHSGAFRMGDKARLPQAIVDQTKRGYAVASINYRLSGTARFPALVRDAKAAIRWLRANAEKYGMNAERIVVAGDSAGGYQAAMLGVTGGVAQFEDPSLGNAEQSSRVQTVIDFYGPTDFLQMDRQIGSFCKDPELHDAADSPESQLMGCTVPECPDEVRVASPLTYITDDDPPFLIFHGEKDCTVPNGQSRILQDALKKAGVASEIHIIPGAGHGGPAFYDGDYRAVWEQFLDLHTAAPATR